MPTNITNADPQQNFLCRTVISGRSRIISSLTRNMEIAFLAEWPVCPVGVKESEKRLADTKARLVQAIPDGIHHGLSADKDIRLSTFSSYRARLSTRYFCTRNHRSLRKCSAASGASLADTRYLFKADS